MEKEKIISILRELWRYKDTDKYSESEIRTALESAASALSTDDGEYIEKEDAIYAVEAQLKHLLHNKGFVAKHGERDFLPLIHEIKAIPTRSIPKTATSGEYIKKEDALKKVEELKKIHFDRVVVLNKVSDGLNVLPTYSFPDSADIEKIRAEITTKIIHYDGKQTDVAYGLNEALEIIDKHIGGKDK